MSIYDRSVWDNSSQSLSMSIIALDNTWDVSHIYIINVTGATPVVALIWRYATPIDGLPSCAANRYASVGVMSTIQAVHVGEDDTSTRLLPTAA